MRQNDERIGTPQPSPVPQTSVGGLNYVIPTEIVELPSKGVLYPPEHPLYGKEYVEIKQMTAKEEDILTSATLIEKGLVLDHLIQSLLMDKSINVKTLFTGDKNAIMLNARINAYGNDYEASSYCVDCGNYSNVTFDLSQVVNKEIDHETNNIRIELPKTNFKVTFRFLNSNEETLLIKEAEKKKNMGLGENSMTTFLQFIITSVNGLSASESDVAHFIENMPASDAKYIKDCYGDTKPDIDFSFEVQCEACSSVKRREVPLTAQFFWPDS